ncbi:hypothetical protein I7I48_06751 [Histoplasma ohiense]|nr:hypothetical protein I7I48_06751 [Histoplasma ohiense (nom. inval.)]
MAFTFLLGEREDGLLDHIDSLFGGMTSSSMKRQGCKGVVWWHLQTFLRASLGLQRVRCACSGEQSTSMMPVRIQLSRPRLPQLFTSGRDIKLLCTCWNELTPRLWTAISSLLKSFSTLSLGDRPTPGSREKARLFPISGFEIVEGNSGGGGAPRLPS